MIRLIFVDDCLQAFIDESDNTLAVWHVDDGSISEQAVNALVKAGVLEEFKEPSFELQERVTEEFWGPDDDA
jgi:hypothetical protein